MSHPPITPEMFPTGIVCGCACGCTCQLTDGNAMLYEEPSDPWDPSDDALPGFVSVCADCYVGQHALSTPGEDAT